eukprot:365862-Chlamydomonas_euryale.AAC.13
MLQLEPVRPQPGGHEKRSGLRGQRVRIRVARSEPVMSGVEVRASVRVRVGVTESGPNTRMPAKRSRCETKHV